MGYVLHALIAHQNVLQSITEDYPEAVLIPLEQKLAMIPNSDRFTDALRRKRPSTLIDRPSGKLWKLTYSLLMVASDASEAGPVAYVEADYAEGKGSQASIVWKNRKILSGPIHAGIAPLPGPADGLRDMPINQALRIVGAERGNHKDAFEALGLGRHRHVEEWISAAAGPAPHDESRDAPRRLTNLYAVGAAVEVFLPDGEWHRGKISRHDHPGVWVETDGGRQWFVTNGQNIRAAE